MANQPGPVVIAPHHKRGRNHASINSQFDQVQGALYLPGVSFVPRGVAVVTTFPHKHQPWIDSQFDQDSGNALTGLAGGPQFIARGPTYTYFKRRSSAAAIGSQQDQTRGPMLLSQVASVFPFNQYDWPPPPRRNARTSAAMEDGGDRHIYLQDQFYGAPGQPPPNYDWPTPPPARSKRIDLSSLFFFQGVQSVGTVHVITPSGGIRLTGAALYSHTHAIIPAGGIRMTGAAGAIVYLPNGGSFVVRVYRKLKRWKFPNG